MGTSTTHDYHSRYIRHRMRGILLGHSLCDGLVLVLCI